MLVFLFARRFPHFFVSLPARYSCVLFGFPSVCCAAFAIRGNAQCGVYALPPLRSAQPVDYHPFDYCSSVDSGLLLGAVRAACAWRCFGSLMRANVARHSAEARPEQEKRSEDARAAAAESTRHTTNKNGGEHSWWWWQYFCSLSRSHRVMADWVCVSP